MKGRQDLNGEFATIECLLDEHIQLKLSSNDIVCVKYANVVKADHMETQVAQMNKDYFFGNDGTILGEKRSLEQYCAVMNRYMVRLLDSSVKGTCTQDITDQMQQDAQNQQGMAGAVGGLPLTSNNLHIESLIKKNKLKEYLNKITDENLYAYNVYQIEGEGRNLFSKINGDKNTIMGLPIEKIQEYLNNHIWKNI